MHGFEPTETHQLSNTSGIIAVGLDAHGSKGCSHMARLHHAHPKALTDQSRIEPLGKSAGLQANMLNLSALVTDETCDRLWLARALAFLDDDAALVDDADTRAIKENVNTDKELHDLVLLADRVGAAQQRRTSIPARSAQLYRQSQMLARQGIVLGREVLADWVGTAAMEILPVVRRLRNILLASPRLFADETTLPVLDPGRGQVKKGFAWAIARDDRPWGATDPPAVVFRYAPGRGKEHAAALLAGYRGILQCDGYAAYKALAAKEGMTLAFCWSHARREFYDLAKGGAAPIAEEALQRIAALYAIEAEIRGSSAELRRAVRQARSRPLVEDLFAWLEAQLARLPGGSPTAEAIRYALNHREGLLRFLDDGRIDVDTNTVERAIRPICISRKNALFASGDDGGARWAAIASLVETCKLNRVDPQRYFTDLLTRLVNSWPNNRIDELMPWCWAPATNA